MLFERVVGHKKIKHLFEHALINGHIGNAYLFSGTAGIGKRLFAFELAKAINCKETGKSIPCNNCINCTRIDSGNYPDFHLIEPDKKQIKIEQIRELIKEISYLPVESGKRVVLIDNAHTMNISASNTFLKTLEDSSSHTIFILTASTIHTIPATILSRCQVIKFSPLDIEDIEFILYSQNIPYDKNLISALAAGSVTNAINLQSKFNPEMLNNIYTRFSELTKDSFNNIFEFTGDLSSQFQDTTDIVIIFKILFLDVFKKVLGQDVTSTYSNIVDKLASKNSINNIHKKIELLNKVEHELRFNLNRKLATERIIFELL